MITRIEIDGFKTFQDFSLDLAPFQVIIGPNGAGKSNLFDALRLLSRLGTTTINEAFRDLNQRGTPSELFTMLPNGESAACMRFAVEVLVDTEVRDNLGRENEIPNPRFRYELHLCQREGEVVFDRPIIFHESLKTIPQDKDAWLIIHTAALGDGSWISTTEFREESVIINTRMLTDIPAWMGGPMFELSKSAQSVEIYGRNITLGALGADLEETLLSSEANSRFPEVLAVSEEMRSWRFLLHLSPQVLRSPSPRLSGSQLASDGYGLAAVLARMKATDQYLLADVSRDMANLVPSIKRITVETDESNGEYRVKAIADSGRLMSTRLLSDGTLRMLALVVLKNDPDHKGVLFLEEPENGLSPFRLADIVNVLRSLATDLTDAEAVQEPLRQVIVNTHSPAIVGQLLSMFGDAPGKRPELAFAHLVTRVVPNSESSAMSVTRIVAVTTDDQWQQQLQIEDSEAAYIRDQVVRYLTTTNVDEAAGMLLKAQVP